jgi:hypothetical protein
MVAIVSVSLGNRIREKYFGSLIILYPFVRAAILSANSQSS